jgi:hypothetical protein
MTASPVNGICSYFSALRCSTPLLPDTQGLTPKVSSPHAKEKWRAAFEKAKIIGKGSLHEGVLIIHEDYWPEVLGIPEKVFRMNGSDTLLHLSSDNYIVHFMSWKQNDSKNTSFLEYLIKNVEKTANFEKIKTIEYKSEEEAKECVVEFKEGKPLLAGKPLEDGKYKFSLSADGKTLYAGKKVKLIKNDLHHCSFTRGSAIKSGGKFFAQNGEIVGIIPSDSGHYKPTKKHGEYIFEYLRHPSRLGKKGLAAIKVHKVAAPSLLKHFLLSFFSEASVMRTYKFIKKKFGLKIFEK